MFDFGISIEIGIEIGTFPGISISIGIGQTWVKSQYRNRYRKSWYRRLLTGGSGGWGESSLQEFDHNHETKNQVFMQINDF